MLAQRRRVNRQTVLMRYPTNGCRTNSTDGRLGILVLDRPTLRAFDLERIHLHSFLSFNE